MTLHPLPLTHTSLSACPPHHRTLGWPCIPPPLLLAVILLHWSLPFFPPLRSHTLFSALFFRNCTAFAAPLSCTRSFFSTLFLRAAKMSRSLGGGSLSALLVVPGSPATGQAKRIDMDKYQTLSDAQKAKIKVRARAAAWWCT